MNGVHTSGRPRDFASLDQLLSALSLRALSMAADAMEDEIARVPVGGDAPDDTVAWAEGAIAAVGLGYVRWAWREPGLFPLAFRVHRDGQAFREVLLVDRLVESIIGALVGIAVGFATARLWHRPA